MIVPHVSISLLREEANEQQASEPSGADWKTELDKSSFAVLATGGELANTVINGYQSVLNSITRSILCRFFLLDRDMSNSSFLTELMFDHGE